MPISLDLPKLQLDQALTESNGTPSLTFHKWWQRVVTKLQEAIVSLETVITNVSSSAANLWYTDVTELPSPRGNEDSITTAFDGDMSKVILRGKHTITGADTLTQPTTGYVYVPEAYAGYGYLYNSSGWNQSTSGNTGRTAACFWRVKVDQYGQGDCVAYNATSFVTGAKAAATHFLANPAGSLFNGDMTAGHDGVYLNPRELALTDAGYDVACIGDVINMTRSNDTGSLSTWWSGYRVQSLGSKAINSVISAVGKLNVGLDLAMSTTDLGTNKAAISLKADQRIYGNNASSNGDYTTSFNGDYLTYSSSLSGWNVVVGGSSTLQVVAGQVTFVKPPVIPTVTASGLPGASAFNKGRCDYVSDANATTRLSVLVGGGSNFVKVFSNGTNWLIQ